MSQYNDQLYKDPKLQYPHNGIFRHYISQCQTLITNTRLDLHSAQAEIIIKANTPFELTPKIKPKAGALLLHGLYDSPLVMRDIGRYLQSQDLHVKAILLPGHGTLPGALLNVSFQDWLETVDYGINSFTKEVDNIFLVGFSTGASLALYHSLLSRYSNIAGLILLAPAIQISSLGIITAIPPKFHWDWYAINEEIDYAKYRSFTFNSIWQVYQLTKRIEKLSKTIKKIEQPVFVCISKDDRTVNSVGTLNFFQKYSSEKSRLVIYTNQPDSFADDSRIIKRTASYPDLNIKNVSHIAIPIAPDNPHYGIEGDYVHASHIETNLLEGSKIIYDSFTEMRDSWRNYFFRHGLIKHLHKRLTFNPDFDFLMGEIGKFINENTSN